MSQSLRSLAAGGTEGRLGAALHWGRNDIEQFFNFPSLPPTIEAAFLSTIRRPCREIRITRQQLEQKAGVRVDPSVASAGGPGIGDR
jgi:hypothetical protein